MNIITDSLPQAVDVCGQNCRIRTDFKVWINFTLIAFGNLGTVQKTMEIIKLLFVDMPPNLIKAVKAAMDFYNPYKENERKTADKKPVKVYDFDYDAHAIYAAFKQQYGIDLRSTDMHWYEFRALLDNLTDDTRFVRSIGFRTMDLGEIKSDELKKYYTKMKQLHALPDNRSKEQKNADFSNAFFAAFVRKGK